MTVKRAIRYLLGDPCEKWMIVVAGLGIDVPHPYPKLCKFRYGKLAVGYDFLLLVGPYATEDAAKAEIAIMLELCANRRTDEKQD